MLSSSGLLGRNMESRVCSEDWKRLSGRDKDKECKSTVRYLSNRTLTRH
jgi:hypothetical protein